MASRKPDRGEIGSMFPCSAFPNRASWIATVECYLDGPGTCLGCGGYVHGPFEFDGMTFHGVCTEHKLTVPNAMYFQCPDGLGD